MPPTSAPSPCGAQRTPRWARRWREMCSGAWKRGPESAVGWSPYVEYAALIDEISKELRKKELGLKVNENLNIDSLLWMDDVCLVHNDLEILQEMLDMTNHVALKYHIQFGAAKYKVISLKGRGKK